MGNLIQQIAEECLKCGACVDKCEYLSRYCKESPLDIIAKFKAGELKEEIPAIFTCNICGLCQEVCSVNINIGELSLELRQDYVNRHGGVGEVHKPLLDDVKNIYTSKDYKTAIRGSKKVGGTLKGSEMVFFPGCALSLNSPHLVKQSYAFLQEKFPGINVLTGCCGAPAHLIGDQVLSRDIYVDVSKSIRDLGAITLIAVCPSCVKLLRDKLPDDIRVVSLYQVLGEFTFEKRPNASHVFNIHDACSTRWDNSVQDSVRKIVAELGYTIEEIPHARSRTQCCGLGGMAGVVDDKYSAAVAKRTLKEVNRDLIAYCATCRANFSGQGARVIHILELIFNDSWEEELTKAPLPFEESVKNLPALIKYFEKSC